jgi:hypothetical protein
MPMVMEKEPEKTPRGELDRAGSAVPPRDDGTNQLLRGGACTVAVGLLAAILTSTVFGGIGRQGPHTNSGWLALLIALMCLPFGSLLLLLGIAKWFRNRNLQRPR